MRNVPFGRRYVYDRLRDVVLGLERFAELLGMFADAEVVFE